MPPWVYPEVYNGGYASLGGYPEVYNGGYASQGVYEGCTTVGVPQGVYGVYIPGCVRGYTSGGVCRVYIPGYMPPSRVYIRVYIASLHGTRSTLVTSMHATV